MKEAHNKSQMDSEAWDKLRQEEREWYRKADQYKELLNKRLLEERIRVEAELKQKHRDRLTEEERKRKDDIELALTPAQKKAEEQKILQQKEEWGKRAALIITQMTTSDDANQTLREIQDPAWKQAMIYTIQGVTKENNEKIERNRALYAQQQAAYEKQQLKEQQEKREREALYKDVDRILAEKQAEEDLEVDCLLGKPGDGSLDSQEG